MNQSGFRAQQLLLLVDVILFIVLRLCILLSLVAKLPVNKVGDLFNDLALTMSAFEELLHDVLLGVLVIEHRIRDGSFDRLRLTKLLLGVCVDLILNLFILRLPSFSGHPICTDLVSVGEDVHCESTAQEVHAGVPA